MQKVPARPDLRPSMSSTDGRIRDGVCSLQQLLAVVVTVVIISRASVSSVSHHYRSFIFAVTTVLFCLGVDSFHFRAVWILSTRLLSVVDCVVRWSGLFVVLEPRGFFPLKCHCRRHSRRHRHRMGSGVIVLRAWGILDARRGAMRDEPSAPEEHWRSFSGCRPWAALVAMSTDNAWTNNAILLRRFSACDSPCGTLRQIGR